MIPRSVVQTNATPPNRAPIGWANLRSLGAENPNAKLTERQVRQIHMLAWRGVMRTAAIAAYYRVDPNTVLRIKNGQLWRHLGLVAPIAPATGRTGFQAREIDGNGHGECGA